MGRYRKILVAASLVLVLVMAPALTTYADEAINPSNTFTLGQPGTNSYLGYPTVLDFNGDSHKDFAFRASPNGQNSSEVVYVVANDGNIPANVDLNSPQNILLTINNIHAAPDTTNSFFWSISSAGDMNGDGKDDLLIFPHVDPTSSGSEYAHTQYAYMVWGGQSGTINLDDFTVSNGVRFKATELYNSEYLLPRSVGDVNGDGYADIAFGDFTKSPSNPNSYDGQTHVVYGRLSAWPTQIDLDNVSAADGYQITGAFNSNSGWEMAPAGDINHDGIGDITITDVSHPGYVGKAFVVFGSSQTQNVSLGNLGSRGYRIYSPTHPLSDFVHVVALGDINNDGMGDLAISNWYSDPSTVSAQNAAVYIVHGKADNADVNLDSSPLVQSTINFPQSPNGNFPFAMRAFQSSLVIATATNGFGQAPARVYVLPLVGLSNSTLPSSGNEGFTISAIASNGTTEYFGDAIADSLVDNKMLLTSSYATSGLDAVLVPFTPTATDTTAPTLGSPTWSANPLSLGQNSTLTVSVSDDSSGVAGGEYFVGSDPGVGNATAMTLSSGSLSATLGSNLSAGVYAVGYRAQDVAGNWSSSATTMLVVYDPSSSLAMTGKNKKDLVPSLANGDIMPGLTSSSQTNAADYGFMVEYKNGALDTHNDFMFTYATGTNCGKPTAQNCHSFSLNASSFAWLIVDQTNNSHGKFQGVASVTVDGVTTTNPFTVEGIDGDRLSPTSNDNLVLKVYAPGADPLTAMPMYRASGSMAKGNSVKIQ